MTTRRTFSSLSAAPRPTVKAARPERSAGVYPDEQTGLPPWITAATGMFATS